MEVDKYKYPLFWQGIRKGFNKARINNNLICPMNSLYNLTLNKFRSQSSTIPIGEFFIKHEFDSDKERKRSKKVEELIQKYSLKLYEIELSDENEDEDNYILMRNDFDELIKDIKQTYISGNYLPLISHLINRAFCISPGTRKNILTMKSNTNNNKSILLKALYEVNPTGFMKCFKSV